MKNHPTPVFVRLSVSAFVAGLAMAGAALAQAPGQAVGEVTLHIGQAVVVSSGDVSEAVRRGTLIRPGDRIETSEGGHVHIRFIDGALVSVRPTSRLVVEDYQYNAQQVAQSLVRFRLEKGVTRAISGAAAEGARDRFRLNTPLVAIGVRGTDFVVRTQFNQTIATVNQGAIVMTPFGEGCSPQAFGPCGSPAARLLSADMGNTLVEFRTSLTQPELKPFNGVKTPEVVVASADIKAGTEVAGSRETTTAKPGVRASGYEAVAVADALVQDVVRKAGDAPAAPPVLTPPTMASTPPVMLAPPELPALPVVPALPVPPAQLAWGRWAGAAFDTTDFAMSRGDARQGRSVTVGDNDFILYRTENGSASLPGAPGALSFGLQQSHARFTAPSGGVSAATVQSGTLSINFSSRLFGTALNLSSAATGPVALQANGSINSDGMFVARSPTQAVAGAVALDTKSAAYLFEKAAAGGTLSGITLWSR